jgi:hypothetical protein
VSDTAVNQARDPGPPPAAVVYPFAAAQSAINAIDRLRALVHQSINAHNDAGDEARIGLSGAAADRFVSGLNDRCFDLGDLRRALDNQHEQLQRDLARAQGLRADQEAAHARWQAEWNRYVWNGGK